MLSVLTTFDEKWTAVVPKESINRGREMPSQDEQSSSERQNALGTLASRQGPDFDRCIYRASHFLEARAYHFSKKNIGCS